MSKLLINEHPLMVLPTLAAKIGLNEAILLQQIHYWLNTSSNKRDGLKWVYNTAEDWQAQFPFWTVITIKRIIKSLRDAGLITTTSKYNKLGLDRTLWYTINYEAVENLSVELPSYQNDTIVEKDDAPLYQNDTTIVSNCYDALYQIDTTNNQRLPETNTETKKLPAARQSKKPIAEQTTESEQQKQLVKDILAAYVEVRGSNSINYGKEGAWAKKIAKQGATIEMVKACYEWIKLDSWWEFKPVSLAKVHESLPEFKRYIEKHGGNVETGAKDEWRVVSNQYGGTKYLQNIVTGEKKPYVDA